MSRARRVDANHAQIIADLRNIGAAVLDVHALPGALDLLVGWRGVLHLVEVKDGAKPPSAQRLTPAEVATIARFRALGCPVHSVTSGDAALRAIGAI